MVEDIETTHEAKYELHMSERNCQVEILWSNDIVFIGKSCRGSPKFCVRGTRHQTYRNSERGWVHPWLAVTSASEVQYSFSYREENNFRFIEARNCFSAMTLEICVDTTKIVEASACWEISFVFEHRDLRGTLWMYEIVLVYMKTFQSMLHQWHWKYVWMRAESPRLLLVWNSRPFSITKIFARWLWLLRYMKLH